MATRFYLPSSTVLPAGVPSAVASGLWEVNTNYAGRACDTVKTNTAMVDILQTKGSTVANDDRINRIYVSQQQLAAQTISAGTFSCVVRGLESAVALNGWLQVIIRVMAADGQSQRGVIYAGSTATVESSTAGAENQEFGTTASTRIKNAIATTSVVAQAGDRMQFEFGARANSTVSTNSHTLRWGDPSATADFALTSGLTTDLCPWIELSNNLVWLATTVVPDLASSTAQAFTPDVSLPLAVTPGLATSAATALAPTVSLPLTVTPGLASSAASALAPTVSTSLTVTPGLASSTAQAFAPDISTPVTATPGLAASTPTAFAPSVSTTLTVTPGLASSTPTAFAPTVTTPVTVTPDLAASTPAAFPPVVTLAGGATTVVPDRADSTAQAYAPSVALPLTVSPDPASSTPAAYDPAVTTVIVVTPDLASSAPTAHAPTVSLLLVVTPDLAGSPAVAYPPTIPRPYVPLPRTAVARALTGHARARNGRPVTTTRTLTGHARTEG